MPRIITPVNGIGGTHAGVLSASTLVASGSEGSQAASRYMGATTSGAPTTGTYETGDWVIDHTGALWICTASGSPGTWSAPQGSAGPEGPPGPQGPAGVSQGQYSYKWLTATTADDPGHGNVKGNNTDETVLTEVYISVYSVSEQAVLDLNRLDVGDTFHLYVHGQLDTWNQYEITGTPVNSGNEWYLLPCQFLDSGPLQFDPNNNSAVDFVPSTSVPVTSVDGQTGDVDLSDVYVDVTGDNMTGNLGLGVPAPTAKVHLAGDTTPVGGIAFGSDTNLYRSAADTLRTDDSIAVAAGGIPATTGAIRLPVGGAVKWRNNADTADAGSIQYTTSGTTVFDSAGHDFRANGTSTFAVDPAKVSLKTGVTFDLAQNQAQNLVTHKSATAPASPVEAQRWYDTNAKVEKFYNGTDWITPGGSAAVASVDGRTGVVVLNDLYVDVAGDTMTGQLNAPRYGVGATPPTTGAIRLTADTLAAGGIYFGSDTNLYRTGPGALRTDGSFMAAIGLVGRNNSSSTNPLAATPALTLRNTNTSNNSLTEISFEDGNGTSVGVLTYRVPDHSTHYGDFRVYTRSPSGMKVRFAVPQTGGFQVYSDASSALTLSATDMGVLQFAADVNLYRSAADTLKTDDTFEALELRTATYRTVSLTRTLPTTIGNMVMIGSFALNNGAAVFDIAVTVQDSSFSVAKRYLFTVQNAITGAAYYQVLPISDTRAHTSNDFALDVNTTGATAYLRLRRLSGGYAGTANISIRHSGKADVFTPDSSSGTSGPAVTTYYPNAIATQAAGNLLIGTPDLPVINTTTAAQFGLDADDRVLTLNGAATGAALNIESTLPMVAGSVGKRFGSIVFTATAGQADVHRQVSGIVSRATALTGNYALQADLGFYVKADTAPVEVLTLTPTATTSSVLVQAPSFRQGPTGPTWTAGTGTPEGAVTAPVGSIFSRSDGGTDTTFYRKESGSGNTGWVATAAGGAGGVTSVDGQTGVVNLSGNYVDVAGDTMTGSLGLGVAPTAKLHFAADTTATGGIGFGADTNLYRVAADTLKTDDSLQVGLVESVIIGSAGRMSIAAGPTVFSDCMLRVGYPGVQNQFASASLVTGLSVQPVNSANGDMRGIEAQPVHSGTGGTVATMIGVTTRVRFANATGTLSSSNALLIDSPLITSGGKINNAYGIMINGQNTAGTQDAVGIYMRAQSPTANGYGILLEAAKTNTLWLSCNANNTTESAGIVFGSSRDTNLYRSAADTLKTDDKMTALAFVTGSAPAVVGAIRMSATDLIAWRNDTNTLDTASITVDGIRELTLESANGGKFTVGGTAICGWYPNAFALADGVGLTVGTTAGSKIGTATTQKLGFWNATPVVQNTGWSVTAGYTALKALDPQTATLAQVARALGTLLDQLKTYGLLG